MIVHPRVRGVFLTLLKRLSESPEKLVQKTEEFDKVANMLKNEMKQRKPWMTRREEERVTIQEVCFTQLLMENGFRFRSKYSSEDEEHQEEGLIFQFQLNGSQQGPDFTLGWFVNEDTGMVSPLAVELKSSRKANLSMNDGWFQENVIYLLSWYQSKLPRVHIGMGHHIRTEADHRFFLRLRQLQQEQNRKIREEKSKNPEIFIQPTQRASNHYPCSRFTPDLQRHHLQLLEKAFTLPFLKSIMKIRKKSPVLNSVEQSRRQ